MFQFKSIRTKFVASVVIIAIIMTLLLLGFTFFVLGNLLTNKTLSEFSEASGKQAAYIEGWFGEKEAVLDAVTRIAPLLTTSDSVYEMLKTQTYVNPEAPIGERELISGMAYTGIGFVDGSAIYSDGWIPGPDWDANTFTWFYTSLANRGQMWIASPDIDTVTEELILTVSMYSGTVLGMDSVYTIARTMDAIFDFMDNLSIPQGGYAFLVDGNGYFVVHEDTALMPVWDVAYAGAEDYIDMDGVPMMVHRVEFASVEHYAPLIDGGDITSVQTPGGEYYFARHDLGGVGWTLYVGVPSGYVFAQTNNMLFWYSLITLFTTIGMVAAIWLLTNKTLGKPMKRLTSAAKQLSEGDLSMQLDIRTRDEIGQFSRYFMDTANIMKDVVNGINKMTDKHREGDIDYRLDEDRYKGAYKEVVQGVNEMAAMYDDIMIDLMDALNRFSAGDFDAAMRQLPGKQAKLNDNIENMRSNLKKVAGEMSNLLDAVINRGDLAANANTDGVDGEWEEILKSFNILMDAVNAPLEEVITTLKALSEGDFSQKMDDKYNGLFKEIALTCNITTSEIASYIEEIQQVLASLANGDLKVSIDRSYVGSFQLIKESINSIAVKLSTTMEDIAGVANEVSNGANMLSVSSGTLSEAVQEQMISIDKLTTGIIDVDGRSKENAENSQKAAELAKTSRVNAKTGNEEMQMLLGAMDKITASSDKISEIIKTIEGIAFQTNLLALNAAVEAARAGDHGKGFSVVAEEVRTLAARSAEAAKQTNDLIQESLSSIEAGTVCANDTAASLDKIVANVVDVEAVIDKIYDTSIWQTQAIQKMNDGLAQISNLIQVDAATSEETAAAAEEMDSQVNVLKEKLAFFQ